MKQQRIAGQITDAGEIIEGATLAVFYPKRRNAFKGWIAMAQDDALDQLATAGLGAVTLRVLLLVLNRVDYDNLMSINQTELAEKLRKDRSAVSRAIAELVKIGVILKGPTVSGRPTYRLNPGFGWKGSAASHRKALTDKLRERGMSVIEGGQAAD